MSDDDSVRAFHENQRRARRVGDAPFAGLGNFLGICLSLAFWLGVLYVVTHFIVKYW